MLGGRLNQVLTSLFFHQKSSGGSALHTAVLTHRHHMLSQLPAAPWVLQVNSWAAVRAHKSAALDPWGLARGQRGLQIPVHSPGSVSMGGLGGFFPDTVSRHARGPPAARCWSTIVIVLLALGGSWCSAAGSSILLLLQIFGTDPVWPFLQFDSAIKWQRQAGLRFAVIRSSSAKRGDEGQIQRWGSRLIPYPALLKTPRGCAMTWPWLLEPELGCMQHVRGSLTVLAVTLHSLEESVFLELLVV